MGVPRLAAKERALAAGLTAAIVGSTGLSLVPWSGGDPLLALVALRAPWVSAAGRMSYELLWFSSAFFLAHALLSSLVIFARPDVTDHLHPVLPPYPPASAREDLFLILGERHHASSPSPSQEPDWLRIPERGLYAGTFIVGAIGTGKTSACLYPYIDQLFGYQAKDSTRRLGGLVLEVKGDFCRDVQKILTRHGRADDYVEISLDSGFRYNPLHHDLDAYALAFGLSTLMTNLYGRGDEPFWQQASTNLMKFVILLHQTLDDYVTLVQLYYDTIDPESLGALIAQGEQRLQARLGGRPPTPADRHRLEQFQAVKRWFYLDWMRIETKLRTSIVEGISVFLSVFDDNPRVRHTFCPPKALYETDPTAAGAQGQALPAIDSLIRDGKVLALNFPMAMNPGLARILGTLLKLDFQRAVLSRVPTLTAEASGPGRPVVFLCDEYQSFATAGENEPSGDEKFFSLARQSRCIPIVATQSLSSLRSTLSGESWRTVLQGFRTKVFLSLSDDFSAHVAADLCGKVDRLKPTFTFSESGQDAKVSLLTGQAAAHKATVSTTKTYAPVSEYLFEPKVFAELPNSQAIVLPYDGVRPHPPTYCFLKPHFLDVQTSYFEYADKGVLS